MNRRTSSALAFSSSIVAATLAATVMAGNALADDITIDTTPFVSTKTRAEVKAELFSQRDQVSSSGSEWFLQQAEAQNPSGYTRAQARADYIASRELVRAMTSEDSGSSAIARAQAQTPSGVMVAKSAR